MMTADCQSVNSHLDMIDMSSALLACAHVCHDKQAVSGMLLQFAASAVCQRLFAGKPSFWCAANMLWSLTVMDLLPDHPTFLSQLLRVFKDVSSPSQLHPTAAMQLRQVAASLKMQGISADGLPSQDIIAEAVAAGSRNDPDFLRFDGSKGQTNIFNRLKKMEGMHDITSVEEEVKMMHGLVCVDMLVMMKDGRKVAVEVDGDYHFLLSDNSKVDGSTHWRNSILAAAVGGRHNVVAIKRNGYQLVNLINGRTVQGCPDKFLLNQILTGARAWYAKFKK